MKGVAGSFRIKEREVGVKEESESESERAIGSEREIAWI